MKHEVAGDPCTGLKWTRRTTHKIARELRAVGIEVSARTVARLLKKLRFSLRINRKMIGRGSSPDRDEQFTYIARLRTRFAARHLPIVSIDSKKKEMVGNFKNGGTAWNRTAVLVNDHDFRSDAKGMALPHGIYDVQGNRGTIFVGISHDTPDFAVDNLVQMVGHRGTQAVPRRPETARPRRRRRKQWPEEPGLQVRAADAIVQRAPPGGHRLPLPRRRVEVEPDRASSVQRDQQELEGPPARQLRDDSQLHPHNADGDRVTCQSPSRHEAIHYRREDLPCADENDRPSATQGPAPTELHSPPNHMKPQNRDLFLRGG